MQTFTEAAEEVTQCVTKFRRAAVIVMCRDIGRSLLWLGSKISDIGLNFYLCHAAMRNEAMAATIEDVAREGGA